MPIYINGKIVKGETITFDSFKEKCFNMARGKGKYYTKTFRCEEPCHISLRKDV